MTIKYFRLTIIIKSYAIWFYLFIINYNYPSITYSIGKWMTPLTQDKYLRPSTSWIGQMTVLPSSEIALSTEYTQTFWNSSLIDLVASITLKLIRTTKGFNLIPDSRNWCMACSDTSSLRSCHTSYSSRRHLSWARYWEVTFTELTSWCSCHWEPAAS